LKQKLRKGLWSPEEDEKLFNYITQFGVPDCGKGKVLTGNVITLPRSLLADADHQR
jgi:myb proto-oncogene protein